MFDRYAVCCGVIEALAVFTILSTVGKDANKGKNPDNSLSGSLQAIVDGSA
jgi:hypothetical protein